MEAYSEFANVYDIFMEDIPYSEWFAFIKEQIKSLGKEAQSVCELGCGTGQMTMLFAKEGCQVIGIDYSPEMLMVAQDHAFTQEEDILYLMQDMSEFEIGQEVDLIYSCCDSINYLLEDEQVMSTFRGVTKALKSEGLFIFDLNTEFKYKETLGNKTFADQTEKAAYIWENFYDEEEKINEYQVQFFIEGEDGRYDRTEECHYQKAYSIEQIEKWLQEAGLKLVACYDNYSEKSVSTATERVTYIAQKND